jgi:segregation and condensation protein A
MASRLPITVRLESFEGPLDLLLYLIQSHELDISRISISKITDQYLAYVRLMQELNFDTASEFLVMAATLLHWKSKAVLPQEEKQDAAGANAEDGVLTQEDLIRQLLEHQRFKQAGQDLAQLPMLGEDIFVRPNRRPPVEKIWKEMNLTDLTLAYQDMLVRQRKRTQVLRKETVSLATKILEFRDKLHVGKLSEFRTLLSETPTRPEIVAAFLATLELSRLKKMRVHQELAYSPIWIELLESLKNFDANMANGFDAPDVPPKTAEEAAVASAVPAFDENGNPIVTDPAPAEALVAAEPRPEDDRRAAMDLTGEVEFNPLAQLDAQMGGNSDLTHRT